MAGPKTTPRKLARMKVATAGARRWRGTWMPIHAWPSAMVVFERPWRKRPLRRSESSTAEGSVGSARLR